MPTADLGPLEALDDAALVALRAGFARRGLDAAFVAACLEATAGLHPLLRRPAIWHHLRRTDEPRALLARAFFFGDAIEPERLARVGIDVARLRDAGLLVTRDEGLACPFALALADDLLILSDPLDEGADAVMGLGPLTVPLCAASRPTRRLHRAMDLGCGAGVLALLLAKRCERVVATDINPRALRMAAQNARLNGVLNVELREGSLFEPVARERFDLVASQPPFIPEPAGGDGARFMAGGARGDELALALLESLPDHLVPGGVGVSVIEWARGETLPSPESRLRTVLERAPVDTLLFEYPPIRAAIHATEYAAALHPALGPSFEAEALRRLVHLDALGVDRLAPSFVVLRRVDHRRPRLHRLEARAIGAANAEHIASTLRALDALGTREGLASARLRRAEGIAVVRAGERAIAELPPRAMRAPVEVGAEQLAWLERFEAPGLVGRVIAEAEGDDAARSLAASRVIGGALLAGLLEVVDG